MSHEDFWRGASRRRSIRALRWRRRQVSLLQLRISVEGKEGKSINSLEFCRGKNNLEKNRTSSVRKHEDIRLFRSPVVSSLPPSHRIILPEEIHPVRDSQVSGRSSVMRCEARREASRRSEPEAERRKRQNASIWGGYRVLDNCYHKDTFLTCSHQGRSLRQSFTRDCSPQYYRKERRPERWRKGRRVVCPLFTPCKRFRLREER